MANKKQIEATVERALQENERQEAHDRQKARDIAFVELRAEAMLASAAVIAAHFGMGADAFALNARNAYETASFNVDRRRAEHLDKMKLAV